MKQFKYQLAKKGKVKCNGCGKKTAVQYIENETGNFVSGAMRCDRESSCGYHQKPETNDFIFVSKHEEIIKKTDYLSLKLVENHFLNPNDCNFVAFLKSVFEESQIKIARFNYLLSRTGNNTIFWQIDQLERVRSGKVMEYNSTTGKRVKDENGKAAISWMHRQPYNLKQCLFGLHLTKEDKIKTICIVESEKTAVIMSIFVPDCIWLATGSKSGFKIEYVSDIKLRKIVAFPDKGCYKEWFDKALEMNNFGYNITVSNEIEVSECLDGEDIADVYLKNLKL